LFSNQKTLNGESNLTLKSNGKNTMEKNIKQVRQEWNTKEI